MNSQKLFEYRCKTNHKVNLPRLNTISLLNILEDIHAGEEFQKIFNESRCQIKVFGSTWEEINEKFQDHLIDCRGCRELYLDYYKRTSDILKDYIESSLLQKAKRLIER